jgi:hypothetical protein
MERVSENGDGENKNRKEGGGKGGGGGGGGGGSQSRENAFQRLEVGHAVWQHVVHMTLI